MSSTPQAVVPETTLQLRKQCIAKFGGKCMCACGCGATNPRRLEFHHLNGAGNKDRLKVRGANLYLRILKQLEEKGELDPPLSLLCRACHGELTDHGSCDGMYLAPDKDATGGSAESASGGRQETEKEAYPWTQPGGWLSSSEEVAETSTSTPVQRKRRFRLWG